MSDPRARLQSFAGDARETRHHGEAHIARIAGHRTRLFHAAGSPMHYRVHVLALASNAARFFSKGASITPFSVIIPVSNQCGVMSKDG